jgi:hypothetical protein
MICRSAVIVTLSHIFQPYYSHKFMSHICHTDTSGLLSVFILPSYKLSIVMLAESIISALQHSLKYKSSFSISYKSVSRAGTLIQAFEMPTICKLLNNPIWPYIFLHRSGLFPKDRDGNLPEQLLTLPFCTVKELCSNVQHDAFSWNLN